MNLKRTNSDGGATINLLARVGTLRQHGSLCVRSLFWIDMIRVTE
jgi:hypothetical protein